ncbi:hypothetical protein ACS8Y6_17700 [Salinisphaera sp. RV14]
MNRTPGSAPTGVSEERVGTGEGMWIDAGARILAYVRANDDILSRDFVPLTPIFDEIRRDHASMSLDDVEHVVKVLAMPRHSRMRNPSNAAEMDHTREQTALLDRPIHERPNKARLTRTGRNAIKLGSTARSFLLTQFKANEISHALRLNLFDDALDALHTVMQRIAEVAEDLRHARERPGRSELVQMFSEQSQDYNAALRDTRIAIEDALALLNSREVMDAMDAYAETGGGPAGDQFARLLNTTLNRLELLGRTYSDFLQSVAMAADRPIGVKDMTALAAFLAFNPPTQGMMDASHELIGPLSVAWPHASISDFEGCLPSASESQADTAQPLDRPVDTIETISPMSLFLEAHRAEILALLAERPVNLSEARERGWLSVMGENKANEMIGVFASPIWLDDTGDIDMRFITNALELHMKNGRVLRGDDIQISLRSAAYNEGSKTQ